MSSSKFHYLSALRTGKPNGKIKIRVMRSWSGANKSGVTFRGINLVVMDAKNNKIHAFIPGQYVHKFEEKLSVGNLFILSNFVVQAYKIDEKFRCLQKDIQLIFNDETNMKDIEEDNSVAMEEIFDFYDHADLKSLANINVYLTDVIGKIQHYDKLNPLRNRFGVDQVQMNFCITDGSSNVNVTFWDKTAESFNEELAQQKDTTIIIIITCCKVTLFNGAVQLNNTAATKFFLNSNHSTVREFERRLKKTGIDCKPMGKPTRRIPELHSVEAISTLGPEYIESEVFTHVKFLALDESVNWYKHVCTTCQNEPKINDGNLFCLTCNRIIPHAEEKFQLLVFASDSSGQIQILLNDRQVRALVRKRVSDIADEEKKSLPKFLKNIINQDYTVQLLIAEVNVLKNVKMYLATNICKGFHLPLDKNNETILLNNPQASSSNIHLEEISELNFQSHATT